MRLGLRPLDRMGETAGAIAAGDLSRRVSPATPRTEVGRLGLALNAMLERLEEAFAERQASEDRLRRFLADASHELRTPLASIRGYAELFRIGAATRSRRGRARRCAASRTRRRGWACSSRTCSRSRASTRCATRSAQPRRPRRSSPATPSTTRAPPRPTATIDAATRDGATAVVGDPHQLRQVLAQPAAQRARAHAAGHADRGLGAREGDGAVRLEVRDHGPGLPAEDTDALFERFWRAEGGRERGRAGAGLGLAIVAAIVDAHGGHVVAANAPGGGARFTVRLPAGVATAAPDEQPAHA